MSHKPRVLVIGAPSLRESLVQALPACDLHLAERALEGVWKGGRTEYQGAFVSLDIGPKALRAVSSLRRVCPQMRIVVGCAPPDEPLARRALAEGADEYVLQPVHRREVELAFQMGSLDLPPVAPVTTGPSPEELLKLSEVLRRLGEGALATLERLVVLVQRAFDAVGAAIQLDELACTTGDARQLVLEATITRQNKPVGRVALAPRKPGAYGADAAGRLAEYARLIEAVMAQAHDRDRWQSLAWTDDLSGLHNRRYFEQTLDQLITRASAQRLRLTLLLFDIDDFKSYNDRFGHDTGDKLIREVAQLLKRCTREHDIVVRYGGDEFAVVFWDAEEPRVPGSEHPHEPIELAARFCQVIAQHNFQCLGVDAPGPVTISGGLACFPWNGQTRAELVSRADQALLRAKRTGKNCLHLAGKSESPSP